LPISIETAPHESATRAETRLTVNEIFHSIQGESTRAGMPCVFVRLTGCNLRCEWCDTAYAFHEGQKMSIDEIAEQVDSHGCDLVEITGGEPLLQEGVHALIADLLDRGKTVMIETSGASDISALDRRAIKIMDLKCPGSGECDRNLWSNLEHLGARDEVKFVVANRGDYEWSRDVIRRYRLNEHVRAVLISPAFGLIEPLELASWILEDRLSARLQLQIHKYVWPPDTRGV